jgi:hypothetical protein
MIGYIQAYVSDGYKCYWRYKELELDCVIASKPTLYKCEDLIIGVLASRSWAREIWFF